MTWPKPEITPLRDAPDPLPWPSNLEIEQRLLGALLLDNGQFAAAAAFVNAADFALAAHQRLFDAIAKIILAGGVANPITLKPYFVLDADFDGGKYLARVARGAVTTRNAAWYAKAVADFALRRCFVYPEPGEDVTDAIKRTRDRLVAFRRAKQHLAAAGGYGR